MKKLAKLNGAKALSKKEQKSINGGLAWQKPPTIACDNNCSNGNALPCTNGAGGICIRCGSSSQWKCVYR